VEVAPGGTEGIQLCESFDPDLILLDVVMPEISGYETARILRASRDEWMPIIFLSGCGDAGSVEQGIDAGGDDYLVKPVDPQVLQAKIRSMKRLAEMRRELSARTEQLKSANAALMRLIDLDGLTGIANRRRLDLKINEEIGRARRNQSPLGILIADIDHFKHVNDTFGHLAGDECLRQIARLLEAQVRRPADLVARYGGEEFCAVLPETDEAGVLHVARRMQSSVAAGTISFEGRPIPVTLSFGVVSALQADPADDPSPLALADNALYEAKRNGRNRICIAGPSMAAAA
jgi:diguanylate cyclase (GGDEF)-like protein